MIERLRQLKASTARLQQAGDCFRNAAAVLERGGTLTPAEQEAIEAAKKIVYAHGSTVRRPRSPKREV
jgi:hypothetical protein